MAFLKSETPSKHPDTIILTQPMGWVWGRGYLICLFDQWQTGNVEKKKLHTAS